MAFGCGPLAQPVEETPGASADALEVTDEEFIQQLADELGEHFHFSSEHAATIIPVATDKLPADLRAIASARAAEEAESVHDVADSGGAFVSDEAYDIRREGRTIGYVVPIEHAIDHPLWDGSGVRVYYDLRHRVVTEVSWSG